MKKRVALCVAEKPTVAKSVAEFLSRGRAQKFISISKYNPVFEFDYAIQGQPYLLRVTSVLGHVMNYKYPDTCKNWQTTDYDLLFQIPLEKFVMDSNKQVVKNVQQACRDVDELLLWLDCDREGEAIAFDVLNSFSCHIIQVIDLCRKVNRNLQVKRAHFSALTREDIERAVQNLVQPNQHLSDAVRVRQEIDLRIGASFTRLQTLNFKDILTGGNQQMQLVISYGPCQFPTLGFIVERFKQIRDFTPEKFWSLSLKISKRCPDKQEEVKFSWSRDRIFDKLTCLILHEKCLDHGRAKIIDINKNRRTRGRPVPLNTIEAQKLISRKLKIASAQAMEIMEKLYQRGILSYPRTETNTFNPTINLRNIVNELSKNDSFGEFANRVASGSMWGGPKNGKLDDKAHPPIHPVKNANKSELGFEEWKVYDLIARHFLATISKDAIGSETKIDLTIGDELFTAKGLIIEEKNWLEVFTFDTWSDTYLPQMVKGEQFDINNRNLTIADGETQAPPLLSESDLITKMDQNGIGTDATIHEHIKTVQERHYAYKQNQSFIPTPMGINLIEAYEHLGLELYKPYLRAQMEIDMKLIAQGAKAKSQVLIDCIAEMKRIFDKVNQSCQTMKLFLLERMRDSSQVISNLARIQQTAQSAGNDNNSNQRDFRNNNNNYGGNNTYPNNGNKNLGEKNSGNKFNKGNSNVEEEKTNRFGGGTTAAAQTVNPNMNLQNTDFATCPQCKKHRLKIKLANKNGQLFIACTGFPDCKMTMSFPKALENISMTDEVCSECLKFQKQKVMKFKLDFVTEYVNEIMQEVLPHDDNTSGVFCVLQGCDPSFKVLIDATYGFHNKRTFDNAFQKNPNGVPNYYYQKPQNLPAQTNSNLAGSKKRKKIDNDGLYQPIPSSGDSYEARDANPTNWQNKENNNKNNQGGGRAPCTICNRKKHVKTSNCPNNKNKA
ncbi:dna topoisomerase [Stylonychia lemnae]|uniref:DNA topoisomerase n=1 Tax=Stylonychia lemnae TaxID=5949 RepID=A0A078AU55_STYLE|nr:dna topoisomerase [Stylonychia lemnae]|eukprot:CDW85516.1 dna topoisomerase [Stylonychia lemnae]